MSINKCKCTYHTEQIMSNKYYHKNKSQHT